jgi:hypothetical protein
VVSFIPGRFTPRGRSPVPIGWKLDGPQSRSGHGGEEKNSHPLPRLGVMIIRKAERSGLLGKFGGRIILRDILEKECMKVWTGFI